MGKSIYQKYIKRLIDIVLSGCGLIVLSPIFLILAILIFADDPGPIFFSQKRVGVNKSFFKLYKISSMKEAGNFSRIKTTTCGIPL